MLQSICRGFESDALLLWWEWELFEVGCDIWWPDCKLSILLGLKWFLALSQAAKLLGILWSSRTPWTISLWIFWSVRMGLVGVSKEGGAWVCLCCCEGYPYEVGCLLNGHQTLCVYLTRCMWWYGIYSFGQFLSKWDWVVPPIKPYMSLLINMEILLIIFRACNIEMTHLGIYYNALNRWS